MKNSKLKKQDKYKPQNNSKDNLYNNNKVNLEVDYFVTGPNTETDRDTSAIRTLEI